MKYSLYVLTLTFLASTGAPLMSRASDWAQFQGPNRDGTSPETGLNLDWGPGEPPIVWTRELYEGFGGAAIVGEEAFFVDRILGETDVLHCVSLENGADIWTYQFPFPGRLPHQGSRGVPTVTEDAVYFTSGFSHVHRVNRTTHQADWVVDVAERFTSESPKWGWAQSPLLIDGVVVVAPMSPTAGLAGLDAVTGETLWTTEPFGDSHSSPTVLELDGVSQVVFVATLREEEIGTTISVDPRSGEVLWKTDVYYNSIPIPFATKIDEERVFLTGGYECGSAMIRVQHRDQSWQVTKLFDLTQGTQIHPPMVVGDHLYFLANENANHNGAARKTGGLMCLDFEGTILWQTGDEPFMGRGNTIMVDGKFLIQDGETGYLRVVQPDPSGYHQLAEADIFGKRAEVDAMLAEQEGRANLKIPDFKLWSPMALSNGRLIMRGQTELKCIDLR